MDIKYYHLEYSNIGSMIFVNDLDILVFKFHLVISTNGLLK